MESILFKEVNIVNEGRIIQGDLAVKNGRIENIGLAISTIGFQHVIEGKGRFLLPGLIDDQVHFREPGLTHKATIYSESRAAVAGGITSYMEMPNTVPGATTQKLLEEKYAIASKDSLANYSFYMGATNSNLYEVLKTNQKNVCGVKIFMGSSTGNMLVDDQDAIEALFREVPMLIAAHCEDDKMIRANFLKMEARYSGKVPVWEHPMIRSREACYASSSKAVDLAKRHNTRFHVLHISTKEELGLFENTLPLKDKKITAEACIHHLWFSEEDYIEKGNFIKWNPAIKTSDDREAILAAVKSDLIDVVATDHAPHTLEEKMQEYSITPSGGPLVQHGLLAMLELHEERRISLEKVVEKMCHNPAVLFRVEERGFIREGYWADLVLVDLFKSQTVQKSNLLYKCGWSPFEGTKFHSVVDATIVSGHLAYFQGKFNESVKGKRLTFSN